VAITDWTKPLYGNFTQYVDKGKNDRDAAYLGIRPDFLQGFNWKDPNSGISIGEYSGANPYQYAGYDPNNGLNIQRDESGTPMGGWSVFGEGNNQYGAYADSQQNGGFIGQLGPDSVSGDAFFSAPQGQRFVGNMASEDPELWKILKPYANAYGSYDEKYGYTIPEEYYKAGTSALNRWTTKGDWKGPASIFAMMAGAVGGELFGLGSSLGDVGSAFPSAAGDGFYNFADSFGGGFGSGFGGGGGNMSFFDDILGEVFPSEVDTSSWGELLGNGYEGLNYGPGWDSGLYSGIDSSSFVPGYEELMNQGGWLQKLSDAGVPFNVLQSIGSGNIPPGSQSLLKKLFGGSGSDSEKMSGLSKLLNAGLIGGGLLYGRNTMPNDVSLLEKSYANLDPNALTYQYDLNTAQGRNQLNSGLASRGLTGSSFGNSDVTNYNTVRDLGRRSLLNSGEKDKAMVADALYKSKYRNWQANTGMIGQGLNQIGLL